MKALKPIVYKNDTGILLCCPNCESNVDWTYETTILGLKVLKWKNGKRQKCKHCSQLIDWTEFRTDIVELDH